MQLQGKTVVITGGASGLGRRTAQYMVEEKGANVAIFDLNDEAGVKTVEEFGARRVLYCTVDVADEASVARGVADVVARYGSINVCINCAGIPTPAKIIDREGNPTCGKYLRTIMVNLVGTYNVMAHCVAEMMKNPLDDDEERGVVVNVASAAAFDGQIGQTAYASSKAGIVGLSLPAARELAEAGIRVNSIAPGLFNTPMLQSLGPKVNEAFTAMIEFPKRLGDMREFASLAAYLCENAYINGECIRLDAATRLRAR